MDGWGESAGGRKGGREDGRTEKRTATSDDQRNLPMLAEIWPLCTRIWYHRARTQVSASERCTATGAAWRASARGAFRRRTSPPPARTGAGCSRRPRQQRRPRVAATVREHLLRPVREHLLRRTRVDVTTAPPGGPFICISAGGRSGGRRVSPPRATSGCAGASSGAGGRPRSCTICGHRAWGTSWRRRPRREMSACRRKRYISGSSSAYSYRRYASTQFHAFAKVLLR